MSIQSKHPKYSSLVDDWTLLRDCFRGERAVKSKGVLYLPSTPGQRADGMRQGQEGLVNYLSYKQRAKFPDCVAQAIEALIGIMHHKPANIKVPARMEPMVERGTVAGESLQQLLRRINQEQLLTGRCGVMADVPQNAVGNVLPYLALYTAENICNWDDGERTDPVLQNLNLVVLNETEHVRQSNLEWERKEKYRVLILGDITANEAMSEGAIYRMGQFDEETGFELNENFLEEIGIMGSMLNEIPFVMINTKDIVPDPDDPPLLGLANLAMCIYRGEADYRQNLFMQGQDTLVVIGSIIGDNGSDEEKQVRAGAGAILQIGHPGDAKYIGVESQGLEEQRSALENDYKHAAEIGGHLLDNVGRDAESGDALRIRVSARTATLNQIALAGAEGLQSALRIVARWVGENPDECVVEPNLDFADDEADGDTLNKWISAKVMGLPWSRRSIHKKMADKGMTELTYEEELAEIEKEEPLDPTDGTGVDDNNEE